MTSPTSKLRARVKLCIALGMAAIIVFNAPRIVDAQGLVKGVEQGAREGNKAAGPVGGVLGGAIGGVVGVVTGVTGVFTGNSGQPQQPAQTTTNDKDKQGNQAKMPKETAKAAPKGAKAAKQPQQQQQAVVLTQQGAPQLTAEQIVSNSDAYIERIKTELKLTPEQEKNWGAFSSAMHYLGHNGAERLNLRVTRAKRDPPDDIIPCDKADRSRGIRGRTRA